MNKFFFEKVFNSKSDHYGMVAVVSEKEEVTYADLDIKSKKIAQFLLSQNFNKDTRVAIAQDRSIDSVVATLGVVRAGMCYVPININSSSELIKNQLATSQSQLIVSSDSNIESILPIFSVEMILNEHQDMPNFSEVDRRDNSPLYIMFTSGSTGAPKGIEMNIGALSNLVKWQAKNSVRPDRTANIAPIYFDVSFQEIFSTLYEGAVLCVIKDQDKKNVEALIHRIIEEKITRIYLPYALLQSLAVYAAAKKIAMSKFALQDIISSGEQLILTQAIKEFVSKIPGCTLTNQYGPTETHVVTYHRLSLDSSVWPAVAPIGIAIDNVSLEVVSDDQSNESGELIVSGIAVANGYISESEHRGFFTNVNGTPSYRTGDLVEYNQDGVFVYLSRIDNEIKHNGFRIDPFVIEHHMNQHSSVNQSVIVSQNSMLVAFLEINNNSEYERIDVELVINLRRSLPEHMVPDQFRIIEKVPLTATGKINRKALVDVVLKKNITEVSTNEPSVKTRLTLIWCTLLNIDEVSDDKTFFDLGGNSILLVQLHSQITTAFTVDISLTEIIEAVSINQQEQLIIQKISLI